MSVSIAGVAVVVRKPTIAARYRGGVAQYAADAWSEVRADDELIAVCFDDEAAAHAWIASILGHNIDENDVAMIDTIRASVDGRPWLEVHGPEASLHRDVRAQRFDLLSSSASGLSYVRERKGGVTRVLTESELADFDDPPPCPECAEQFGCDHFNCAGEPLLTDSEIEADVPRQWSTFARDYGLSRADLRRLQSIERSEGEYRLAGGVTADMRMLELVLLLNEAR